MISNRSRMEKALESLENKGGRFAPVGRIIPFYPTEKLLDGILGETSGEIQKETLANNQETSSDKFNDELLKKSREEFCKNMHNFSGRVPVLT